MEYLNEISTSAPKSQSQIKPEELVPQHCYAILRAKQTQTKYGLSTYLIIEVEEEGKTTERLLFLPRRLNNGFSEECINLINKEPSKKYVKFLGSAKSYSGAKASYLYEFGDL